ncbi:carboxypeptidase N subunit 2-like [Lethenteron reissneri]|uniref:carboxypeptidase N subunit 2-like n=1 Tax=Lethenteron reissneri TaxID=7753 RepID=UPI002AB6B90A|nr:carboxypeptidase N subunit 2-like [Lethenteron reissneri]
MGNAPELVGAQNYVSSGLRYTNCDSKGLSSVPSGIPDNTQALQLQGNRIKRLPDGLFDAVGHILANFHILYLSGHLLMVVPEGVFNRLVNLQNLFLNQNQLSALPTGVFDHLVNLNELYLDNNQLQAIPHAVFDQLTELTRLDMEANQLKSLPPKLFDKLGKLMRLQLHANQLTTVPTAVFDLSTARDAGSKCDMRVPPVTLAMEMACCVMTTWMEVRC